MRPQLWVIAGPNGAGKSTLTDKHLTNRLPLVNPDNIARDNPGVAPIRAGKLAVDQQQRFLAQKKSFAWETTLSGKSELGLMAQAKAAGYKVNLVYVGVDRPLVSQLRVQARVASGGHEVPTADIVRRYQRSMDNLPNALKIADRAYVFDNSGGRRRLLLSRELDKTKYVSPRLPRWAEKSIPRDMTRSKELER